MPFPSEQGGSARIRKPAVFGRADGGRTSLHVQLGAAASDLDGSGHRYRLLSATSNVIVEDTTPTVSGGWLHVDVDAEDLEDAAYGVGYREEWRVFIDGTVRVFTRPAVIARYPLQCPITSQDLDDRYKNLTGLSRGTIDIGAKIDEAWGDVVRKLITAGRWPEEIVDVDTLIDPTRERALELVFAEMMAFGDAAKFSPFKADHAAAYLSAMRDIQYRRDADQDGAPDSDDRESAYSVVPRGMARRRRRSVL